jgi:hypothetical protein
MATIVEEIIALFERLPPEYQQQVLEFAQKLAEESQVLQPVPGHPLPKGRSNNVLPAPKLPLEVVEEEAVEETEQTPPDSEQIDVDEW